MKNKIALAASPLTGKSTFARHLSAEYGYVVLDMALPIHMRAARRLGISLEDMLISKETHRELMQKLGTELGYDDEEKYRKMIVGMLREVGDVPVVIDNIRGDVQAGVVKGLGFFVVKLWISEAERSARARSRYERMKESMAARPDIENGVKVPDLLLYAGEPVERMAGRLFSHQ